MIATITVDSLYEALCEVVALTQYACLKVACHLMQYYVSIWQARTTVHVMAKKGFPSSFLEKAEANFYFS